jgi:hypothetical protein
LKTAKEISLTSLTKKQRKTLNKNNPFIVERNALIRSLFDRGMSIYLLAEITGLSKSTTSRIATRGYIYGRRKDLQHKEARDKSDIRGIKKAFKALYNEVIKTI